MFLSPSECPATLRRKLIPAAGIGNLVFFATGESGWAETRLLHTAVHYVGLILELLHLRRDLSTNPERASHPLPVENHGPRWGVLIIIMLHTQLPQSVNPESTLCRLESWSSDPSPGYAAIGPHKTKVSHCQPNSPLRYPGMDLPRKAEECDPPVVRAYSPGTRDGSHPPPTPCRHRTCRPPHPRVHLRVPIQLHSTGASNRFFSVITYML